MMDDLPASGLVQEDSGLFFNPKFWYTLPRAVLFMRKFDLIYYIGNEKVFI